MQTQNCTHHSIDMLTAQLQWAGLMQAADVTLSLAEIRYLEDSRGIQLVQASAQRCA